MKKKNFTESKILSIIRQYEGGRAIDDVCRENGISKATVYNWKKKYSGLFFPAFSQLASPGQGFFSLRPPTS
jgi:putative transposase